MEIEVVYFDGLRAVCTQAAIYDTEADEDAARMVLHKHIDKYLEQNRGQTWRFVIPGEKITLG